MSIRKIKRSAHAITALRLGHPALPLNAGRLEIALICDIKRLRRDMERALRVVRKARARMFA